MVNEFVSQERGGEKLKDKVVTLSYRQCGHIPPFFFVSDTQYEINGQALARLRRITYGPSTFSAQPLQRHGCLSA